MVLCRLVASDIYVEWWVTRSCIMKKHEKLWLQVACKNKWVTVLARSCYFLPIFVMLFLLSLKRVTLFLYPLCWNMYNFPVACAKFMKFKLAYLFFSHFTGTRRVDCSPVHGRIRLRLRVHGFERASCDHSFDRSNLPDFDSGPLHETGRCTRGTRR